MNYKSPINIICSEFQTTVEGEIFKAVQRVGVNVDKDELLKALQYDRGQYQKGYADRDSEIVRCGECKYYREGFCYNPHAYETTGGNTTPDWFCADGERRSGDEGTHY